MKKMELREIREKFLKYFEVNGHVRVKSSSLIPKDDPTLLFTNAGMVQFKRIFTGEINTDIKRATTVQKCVRAGGKHNDLEKVGLTARHHTFFEMLGNFSFGEYFKREAISMAWEFIIKEIMIPKEIIYVTIFKDDDESYSIWREIISEDRIYRMDEKDNFWAMGDTGPCGPCSEIIVDLGSDVGCGRKECKVGCDCDRYLELWNLVFMQFNRDIYGKLEPLPKPSIDTGMGLERLASVVQGCKSNYDTDIFREIIRFFEDISNISYGNDKKVDVSFRVLSDHIRAATFLIGDGLLPSNESRGYVLRRIIRRALRYGKRLGFNEPFLYKASGVIIDIMGDAYPELKDSSSYIALVIKNEEERFLETLDRGLKLLYEEIDRVNKKRGKVIAGEVAFKLYDTFGFPIDLIDDICKEDGFSIDIDGFNMAMEAQKERGRKGWKGIGNDLKGIYMDLFKNIKIEFTGYKKLSGEAKILKIIKDDRIVDAVKEGDRVEIVVDQTPFYGESGGQVGDKGGIFGDDKEIRVYDTIKPLPDIIIHKGIIKKGIFKEGESVFLNVDEKERHNTEFNHTATHLLHSTLRKILGDHVKQAGSLVAPDRLRFDFTHFSNLSEREIKRIEDMVNEKIWENLGVDIFNLTYEEAINRGAVALFDEKYGDYVRVVRIADYSMELCGGTHTKRTGDIGLFKIVSEGGIAAGVRRIEALTGRYAFNYLNNRNDEILIISKSLGVNPGDILKRIDRLKEENKILSRDIESLERRLMNINAEELISSVRDINGIKVISSKVNIDDSKKLRNFADILIDRIKRGIVLLGSVKDNRVSLVISVSKDLIERYHAGNIMKEISAVVGGKGGGKANMGEGGGKDPQKLEKALNKLFEILSSG